MAYSSISDPESIATLVTAITALIGGIATFIYKVRGRSLREVINDLLSNRTAETKEFAEVVKTQTSVIKDVVEKAIKSGQDRKEEKK